MQNDMDRQLYSLFLELRDGQKVLFTQVKHIKEHLEKQNGKLFRHEDFINELKIQAALEEERYTRSEKNDDTQRYNKKIMVTAVITIAAALITSIVNIILNFI